MRRAEDRSCIALLISKAVGAVEVGFWLVAKGAISVNADLAVLGCGDDLRGKAGDVWAQVIGQRVDDQAAVFKQRGGIIDCDWGADQAHVFNADMAAQLRSGHAKAYQVKAQVDWRAGRDTRQVKQVSAALVGRKSSVLSSGVGSVYQPWPAAF